MCEPSRSWERGTAALDEDESLHRYGLHPTGTSLDEVRELLSVQTRFEQRTQGKGDTELTKRCRVQLFNAGLLDDVLLIRNAGFLEGVLDAGAGVVDEYVDGPPCLRPLRRSARGHRCR